MGAPVALHCPVRLLHGQADADVPWETALQLARRIEGEDVQVLLVKDGAHRMSRPAELRLLETAFAWDRGLSRLNFQTSTARPHAPAATASGATPRRTP